MAGASWWLGRDGWRRDADGVRPLAAWLKANRWLVLTTELLFLGVLVGWAVIRAYNPDIAGTEKPMEFAFVNGILRSPLFPPQDPWLSGYGISYYYFGYVMLAALVNLTGVDPAVAFNLGVALWYALVMIGAFGVVYDLVRLAGIGSREQEPGTGKVDDARNTEYGIRNTHSRHHGQPRPAASAMACSARCSSVSWATSKGWSSWRITRASCPLQWLQWLDIKQLTDNPPSGNLTGGFWWWWHASRVIHDKDLLGNSIEVIDEFPFFSFLLGDMHPHVLALPFAILAVALALNLLLGARSWKLEAGSLKLEAEDWWHAGREIGDDSSFKLQVSSFWSMLGGATGLGRLRHHPLRGRVRVRWRSSTPGTFPIYVGLAMLALGVGLALADRLSWGAVGRCCGRGHRAGGARLAALSAVLSRFPIAAWRHFAEPALPVPVQPVHGDVRAVFAGSRLLSGAASRARCRAAACCGASWSLLPFTLLVPLLLLAAVALSMAVLPQGKAFVQEVLNNPAVQANVGSPTLGGLLGSWRGCGWRRLGPGWRWPA